MKNFKLLLIALFTFQNGFSQNWTQVGSGLTGSNSYVNSFIVFNGELYAGGNFDTAGGFPASKIAKWNGTNWSAVGNGLTNGEVSCLTIHNGELYAGGNFHIASNQSIARWDGSNWQSVGNLVGYTYSLSSYNGELYVGGYFSAPFTSNFAKWNGNTWVSISNDPNLTIISSAIFSGGLYLGGSFQLPAKNIAKCNGINFFGAGDANGYVESFESDTINGRLYSGGEFDSIGGVAASGIARWNGTSWSALGTGITSSFRPIYAMKKGQNNDLYVGGRFDQAGLISLKNIAKWDGFGWSSVGSGMNNEVRCLAIYNGELYAGGRFDTSGIVHTSHIAKISIASGINELSGNYKPLKVYPNPAVSNQPVTIEVGSYKGALNVYDCLGNLVQTEQKKDVSKITLNLPTGMYYLKLDDGSGKLLVQ